MVSTCHWQNKAVHPPRQRIHSDGSRFFEASVEQNFLLGSVEIGNRNGFGAKIRPIQVLIDPVHSDSHRSLDVVYHFFVGANIPSFVQHSAARIERTETISLTHKLNGPTYECKYQFID